jgi:hypothetical protein
MGEQAMRVGGVAALACGEHTINKAADKGVAMRITSVVGSDVWHSNAECTAISMKRDHSVALELETRDVEAGNVVTLEGTVCLCLRTAVRGVTITPEAVADEYVNDELAALAAAEMPDWTSLGHLITYNVEEGGSTSPEMMCAFEAVRQVWRAREGTSVLRRRLARAMAKPSQIPDRETFCELQVTTESVEALGREWGQSFWSGNVVTAWTYKMADCTTDDEVIHSMMLEFARGPELTALTCAVNEMMFSLLERSTVRCSARDRVIVIRRFGDMAKKLAETPMFWDLLGRYLVGFENGNGVMVLPGFEFDANEKRLTDGLGSTHGPAVNKVLLDFGILPVSCAIDFDCAVPEQLTTQISRLSLLLETATTLWVDAGGPSFSETDYQGRYQAPKDKLMRPSEAMRVAAAALS